MYIDVALTKKELRSKKQKEFLGIPRNPTVATLKKQKYCTFLSSSAERAVTAGGSAMGAALSSPIVERAGGFPWHAIQATNQLHGGARSSLLVAQCTVQHGGSRTEKLLAYKCTMHGGSRCVDAIVFHKATLHGGAVIGMLHCLASTKVVQHGGSAVKKRELHSLAELVAMARALSAVGNEILPVFPALPVAHAEPVLQAEPSPKTATVAAVHAVPIPTVGAAAVAVSVGSVTGRVTTDATLAFSSAAAPAPSAPPMPMVSAPAISQSEARGFNDVAAQLTQLGKLFAAGALDQAEFESAKSAVIGAGQT